MNRATLGALAAAALLAACGDTKDPADPGTTGDQFERAEALAVVELITQVSEDLGPISVEDGSMSGADATPGTISIEHESTHPCPVDGRIALALNATLSYDEETQSLEYDGQGTLTHQECGFVHEDVTITVSGDPNLTATTHAAIAGGEPEGPFTQSIEGAFLWSASDGRSGRCVVELDTVTDLVGKSRTVQGEVCGHTIDQTITWT